MVVWLFEKLFDIAHPTIAMIFSNLTTITNQLQLSFHRFRNPSDLLVRPEVRAHYGSGNEVGHVVDGRNVEFKRYDYGMTANKDTSRILLHDFAYLHVLDSESFVHWSVELPKSPVSSFSGIQVLSVELQVSKENDPVSNATFTMLGFIAYNVDIPYFEDDLWIPLVAFWYLQAKQLNRAKPPRFQPELFGVVFRHVKPWLISWRQKLTPSILEVDDLKLLQQTAPGPFGGVVAKFRISWKETYSMHFYAQGPVLNWF